MKLLAEAKAIAHGRKHAVVLPEHVLAAIAADDDAWRARLAPVSRHALVKLVAERLALMPETGAYRDGVIEAPVAPEIAALFASRWRLIPRPTDGATVLERLAALPAIAPLLAEATLDLKPLEADLSRARALTAASQHAAGVKVEHVLFALAERQWMERALLVLGCPRERFFLVLSDRLNGFVVSRRREPTWLSNALQRMVDETARTYRSPTSDMLLATALRDELVEAIFTDAGVLVTDLKSLLLDGIAAATENDGLPAVREGVDVLFHDDDRSTQELVVHVLQETFGYAPLAAMRLMLRVHHKGEAVVGTYPAAEARDRAERATAVARAAGFPLRISLRDRI